VVINNENKTSTVEFDVANAGIAAGATFRDSLGAAADATVTGRRLRVTLPARSSAVFVRR
jgi:hypothetical protein